MQLIMSPLSPYVRKVRVLIRETGLLEQVQEVAVQTSALATDPAVLAAHPTGRIPVLIRDDGKPIHDSRVITRYLDEIADGGFYPSNRLWDVLTQEATVEGILDSAIVIAYENRLRPEERQWDGWKDAHWAKITHGLSVLEADWDQITAHPVDMSQIAMGCALAYLDFRHDARNWRAGHDRLAAWYAAFSERPTMQATRPV